MMKIHSLALVGADVPIPARANMMNCDQNSISNGGVQSLMHTTTTTTTLTAHVTSDNNNNNNNNNTNLSCTTSGDTPPIVSLTMRNENEALEPLCEPVSPSSSPDFVPTPPPPPCSTKLPPSIVAASNQCEHPLHHPHHHHHHHHVESPHHGHHHCHYHHNHLHHHHHLHGHNNNNNNNNNNGNNNNNNGDSNDHHQHIYVQHRRRSSIKERVLKLSKLSSGVKSSSSCLSGRSEDKHHADADKRKNSNEDSSGAQANTTATSSTSSTATNAAAKSTNTHHYYGPPSEQVSAGGLRSKKLEPLIHPLDRSIVGIFTLTIFFTILAILTGAPIVAALFALLPFVIALERLFECRFFRCSSRFCPSSSSSSAATTSSQMEPLSSIDSFWISPDHVTHCVLHLDQGLSLPQLRDVLATRLLARPELARFKSKLVFRGLCRTPYWKLDDQHIDRIDEHVVEDAVLRNKRALRRRLLRLMTQPLPPDRPLWQILYCRAPYCSQVVLIVRVHQTLAQSGLVTILTHYLADDACASTQPHTHQTSSSSFSSRRASRVAETSSTSTSTTSAATATPNFTPPHGKTRFGGATLSINIFRAIIVGPLTFFLWILWAFTRRQHNYLTRTKDYRSVHWMTLDLPRVYRIKQVTRSSLNDVLLSSIAGSLRAYLTTRTSILNPPDLTVSIPIDIRAPDRPVDCAHSLVGVNYVLTTSPIPTNTEGAIPRLWEVRHLMEELKTSADTAVMYGAHYLLNRLLPRVIYRLLLNLVNRNSSIYVSNIDGPRGGASGSLSIGSHRLIKAHYFISPPSYCSIVYNIFTANDKLHISICTRSRLIGEARYLSRLLRAQIDLLHVLLARRRVPGESKRAKRAMYLGAGDRNLYDSMTTCATSNTTTTTTSSIYGDECWQAPPQAARPSPKQEQQQLLFVQQQQTQAGPSLQLLGFRRRRSSASPSSFATAVSSRLASPEFASNRLHDIQDELARLTEAYDRGDRSARLTARYEELKEEFTSLLYEMRRRKSIADHGQNILINIENEEDDENDGELRPPPPPRRFSVVSIGRRGSLVSPAVAHSRVTPPILSRRSAPISSSSPEPPSSPDGATTSSSSSYKIETEC